MAFKWHLGETLTGNITRSEPLPAVFGKGEVALDIHGEDYSNVQIAKNRLTAYERENFVETFAEIQKFCVLENDALTWDDPGAVLFAGWINKLKPQLRPGIIELQLAGFSEHAKARLVGETWNKITDPSYTILFTGSNWANIVRSMLIRLFSNEGIPAGKPQNPNIIGTIQAEDPTAGSVEKKISPLDAITYFDAIETIGNDDAGNGLEWRLVPRWESAAKNRIVCDIIIGTMAAPHINENITINLELSENSAKFSSWDTTIDSNELYSKLYIQSKTASGDATTGADFSTASVSSDDFPILIERFFNPGVELTDEQMQAQLDARIAFAAKSKYTVSFTVEEQLDPSEWRQNIGKTIVFTGVNGTISEGHSATVRVVGIKFVPGKGTVKIDVMQVGPTYPRLPSISNLGQKPSYNGSPISAPATGGGITPPPPAPAPVIPPYAGVDGIFKPSDLFGDTSHNPWDTFPPKTLPTLAFKNRIDSEVITEVFDGRYPIHPYSICTGSGNRLYGLDRISFNWESQFNYQGTETHQADGPVDRNTGMPVNGFSDVFIKKTYMAEGKLGPIVTVGKIPSTLIRTALASWATDDYGTQDIFYSRSIGITNFIVGDRFYIVVGNKNIIATLNNATIYSNAEAKIYSAPVDIETGIVSDDWKAEGIWDNGLHSFPLTPWISKSGNVVLFTDLVNFVKTLFKDGLWGGMNPNDYYNKELEENSVTVSDRRAPFGYMDINRSSGSPETLTYNGGYIQSFASIPVDLANENIRTLRPWSNPGANAKPGFKAYSYTGKGVAYGKHLYLNDTQSAGRIKMISNGGIEQAETWQDIPNIGQSMPVFVIGGNLVSCYIGSSAQIIVYADISKDTPGAYKTIDDPQQTSFFFTAQANNLYAACMQYGGTFPLAEESQTNSYQQAYEFASKVFVYDNRIYNFQLQLNNGVRNKLAVRSMEAYDPTA